MYNIRETFALQREYRPVTAYTVTRPVLVNGVDINAFQYPVLNYQPEGAQYPYIYVPIANFSMVGARVNWDDSQQLLTVTSDYKDIVNKNIDLEAKNLYLTTILNSFNIPPQGNTVDNIRQYGFVAEQGDWVYYKKYSSPSGTYANLYKIRKDGSQDTWISNDNPTYINVLGNFIYYREELNSNLFRIAIDGSGRTALNNDRVNYVIVVGDWIYYSNETDGGKIYKIKTDGTNRTKISDDRAHSLNIIGDWIYYRNPDNFSVYKIRTDGIGWTKISDNRTNNITVVGDWIYYSFDKLYRMKTDGTNTMQITNDNISNYNISNGWIYYQTSQAAGGGILYKTKLDGTERVFVHILTVLTNIFPDWVYYIPRENVIYKIRPDGTENQRLYK